MYCRVAFTASGLHSLMTVPQLSPYAARASKPRASYAEISRTVDPSSTNPFGAHQVGDHIADDMVGRSRSAIDRGGVPAATKLVRTMESAAWKEPRVSAS